MSSRTTRKLIGLTPDGTEVEMMTSGDYDTAGIVKNRDGNWSIVAKGWSSDSVRSRTSAYFGRSTTAVSFTVVPLMEDIPQQLKDYFPGDQMYSLRIRQVSRGGGFMNARELGLATRPSKRALRQLKKAGFTLVGVGLGNRVADFTLDELTRIDRRPALGGALVGSRTR